MCDHCDHVFKSMPSNLDFHTKDPGDADGREVQESDADEVTVPFSAFFLEDFLV